MAVVLVPGVKSWGALGRGSHWAGTEDICMQEREAESTINLEQYTCNSLSPAYWQSQREYQCTENINDLNSGLQFLRLFQVACYRRVPATPYRSRQQGPPIPHFPSPQVTLMYTTVLLLTLHLQVSRHSQCSSPADGDPS